MMKRKLCLFLVLFGTFAISFSQNVLLTGVVKDSKTKAALKDVNVMFIGLGRGVSTDDKGAFSTKLASGKYEIQLSFVGYEKKNVRLRMKEADKTITIFLDKSVTKIGEVKVTGLLDKNTGEETAKVLVPIKDVPVTVSSVSRNLIEQTQVNNVNDAMRYATGITPYVKYGGFQTFNMRGFGVPIIMVDGARDERMNLSTSAPLSSLSSVERIEFLKGPASVLYGHSAVGGIINIIRKKPSDEFHGSLQTSYGSWDTKSIEVGVGGGIVNNLTYRFDANLIESKGWRDNYKKVANAYAAINYKINDKNNIELRLGANDDYYGTETGLPTIYQGDIYDKSGNIVLNKGDFPKGMKRNQRYNDPSDFLNHEDYNVSIKYDHKFSDKSKLTFNASYSSDLIDYFSTESLSFLTDSTPIYDTYYVKSDGSKKYIDLTKLNRNSPLRFSHETDMYQHYIDYTGQFKTGSIKHNILAGYYLSVIDRTSFEGYDVGKDVKGAGLYANVNIVNPILNQGALITKFSNAASYKFISNGVYAQDVIDISKQFKAMIGFRFDHYIMYKWQDSIAQGRETRGDPTDKKKMVNMPFSFRGGLVYEPIETLSLYASYSTFFKPNRDTYSSQCIYINTDGEEFFPAENKGVFKPESGFQAEAGVKFELNDKLQVNVSSFYIKKNNVKEYLGQIYRIEDGKTVKKYIYGQVGFEDSKGFDVEVLWSPAQGFTMNMGYGYLEAKYQQFAKNKYSENSREGNYKPHNPKDKLYFWAYYTVPAGVLKNFSVGMGCNYSASDFFNAYNTVKVDSYFFADAAVGYTFNNAYVKFKINNIYDKTYYTNAVYSTQLIPSEGRNYLLSIGYKF